MKWLSKAIAFLVVACLILGMVGCGGGEKKEIKVGVIGPMEFQMGKHHWMGATLAADEINAAGGIKVGDDYHKIKLVKVDSNELASPTDAASAAERAITVDKVDFLMGTIRSEAALAVQEVAMDYKTIFMVCGSSETKLSDKVRQNYGRYKYWFRITPVNNTSLGRLNFLLVEMVASQVEAQLGKPVKLAVLAEQAVWADAIVTSALSYLPTRGIPVTAKDVWRPSDKATDLAAELQAIKDSGANIIMTALSGTVGIAYGKQWEELKIPAASVGINVMAQADSFIASTGGLGNYEMTLNVYARGVELTDKTAAFMDAFIDEMGEAPTYNAGTYDAMYILKEAIERADSLEREQNSGGTGKDRLHWHCRPLRLR